MSFTIDRISFARKNQDILPSSRIGRLTDVELARLAKDNLNARVHLVTKNLETVKQAARYITFTYHLKEASEEFESVAFIKILTPETWEKYNGKSNPKNFISIVSMNAIRDALTKENRQRRFINQFNEGSKPDQSMSLEEYLVDPLTENPNKRNGLPELEETNYEILKIIPSVYKEQGSRNNLDLIQKTLELSFGIDLGTNPKRTQLKQQEIAKELEIRLSQVKNIKHRFYLLARERLLDKVA
ncbi:MAG: hypothetical protein A3I68_04745 [Candidatus Melainabacteria bacterium RIFCSPLOWO2_02_FULL_35_15]|nr:MAG: hypothetical protein A3I68_04745 [Candidatus Melainabacteria bacterium RIFCSPLOWO2_02_FULL_35_15]